MTFAGIPENPNVEEFKCVWKRSGHLKLHGISLLAALLNTQEQVLSLHDRLKFSAFERDLALFIVEHREPKPNPKPLLPYQQLLAKTKYKQNNVHQWILEVMKYNNFPHREQFAQWQVPKFPINGIMLKDAGVEAGRIMGHVMHELKLLWADNEFEMSADELMKEVPRICDKLKERSRNKN